MARRTFCLACGTITPSTRCPQCEAERQALRYRRKGWQYSTPEYRAQRRSLNLDDPNTRCSICQLPATSTDPLQADHIEQLTDGGHYAAELRPVHRSYNARRGAGMPHPYCTPPQSVAEG